MIPHRHRASRLALVAAIAAATGCDQLTTSEYDLQKQLDAARSQLRDTQRHLSRRDATIDALRTQLRENERLADVPLDHLFLVDRIEIVGRSGGADLDDKPGDDAIIVYVRPLDADGDIIKAAGDLTVQLLDLTAPDQPEEIGRITVDQPDELRKLWYGGLLTDHYRLVCEFSALKRAPHTREIHIRVTFVDWLTGRVFHSSKTVHVNRVDTTKNTTTP